MLKMDDRPDISPKAKRISLHIKRRKKLSRAWRVSLSVLAIAALLSVIILAVFLFIKYREKLSADEIREAAALRNANTSILKIGGAADTMSGSTAEYVRFSAGIACVTTSGIRYATENGLNTFSVDAVFSAPAVSSDGSRLLAYDLSGTNLVLVSRSGTSVRTDVGGVIIGASVSGAIAAWSECEGYRSMLTIYDDELKPLYEWRSKDYYISFASVSPDGSTALCSVIFTDNGGIASKLIWLNLKKEGIAAEASLGSDLPLAIYSTSGGFLALTDSACYSLDMGGSVVGKVSFGIAEPRAASFDGSDTLFILLDVNQVGRRSALVCVNSSGLALCDISLQNEARAISAYQGKAAVLTSTGVSIYDSSGKLKKLIFDDSGLLDVILLTNGKAVMFSANEISIA